MAFYNCSYILRTGVVCNQRCYYPKGCKVHFDSKQVPCKECGKLTKFTYEFCDKYAKKHKAKEQYHQKKLVKLTST